MGCKYPALLTCLFFSLSGLRGQESLPPAPAAKTVFLEMKDFVARASGQDEAFALAIAAARKVRGGPPLAGEPIPVVLNLEHGAVYRITRSIEVSGLDAFEIHGQGAKIINTTLQTTLHIQSCRHVVVRDLSIDYDPLPFTQGTVTSFDRTGQHVMVKVDHGYPEDPKFLATIHDAYFCVMDRQTKALKPGARTFLSPNKVERTGEGLIRVDLAWSANDCGPGQVPLKVGDAVKISASYPQAVVVEDSAATAFIGFTVYASPGMGILENGGPGGTLLQNVSIVPGPRPPGATEDRLISANADGVHFIAVEHGPTIENCTFANTCDDAVNVHGFYVFVLEKIAARTYLVSPKWDVGLLAGDPVEAYEKTSARTLGQTNVVQLDKKKTPELKAKIAALWKGKSDTTMPDTVYEIVLKDDLPLKVGDALCSLNRLGAGTVIRNCSFHACGRVMVKSPNSVIENNRFGYSSSAAIFVGSDIGYWAESNFANNTTIRNNTFLRCNIGANNLFADSDELGTICVGMMPPVNTDGYPRNFANRNVVIEGNRIDDSYIYAVCVSNSEGTKVVGNVIGRTFVRGQAFAAGERYGIKPDSAILLGMSTHAEITGNTVAKDAVAKQSVFVDRTCPKGSVTVRDNHLH